MKKNRKMICTAGMVAVMMAIPTTVMASNNIDLTMFWGSGEDEAYTDYLNQTIADFETENPNITINVSLSSDPEGQIKQQMAAGGGPDIIVTDPTSMHVSAAADYLVSLQSYAEEYGWSDKFDDWVKNTLSYNGELYGLPKEMDAMLVYYNKTMFDENGWKIPNSWDELIDLCEKMTEQGVLPFSFGTANYKQANQWWISQAFASGMGQDDLHSLLQGEIKWDSEEVRDTVEKLVYLWQNNYIYQDSAAITMDEARTLFSMKKAGMYMSGSWEISQLEAMNPDFDWDVFQMPAWRDGIDSVLPVAFGGSYSINAKCENPDAVAKFLNFMYQPERAAHMAEFGTLYPMNGIDISDVEVSEKTKEVQKFINESLDTEKIGYCAWTYWPANTDTYSWSNIEAVVLGQTSVDEYLKKLQENYELDMEKDNVLEF